MGEVYNRFAKTEGSRLKHVLVGMYHLRSTSDGTSVTKGFGSTDYYAQAIAPEETDFTLNSSGQLVAKRDMNVLISVTRYDASATTRNFSLKCFNRGESTARATVGGLPNAKVKNKVASVELDLRAGDYLTLNFTATADTRIFTTIVGTEVVSYDHEVGE